MLITELSGAESLSILSHKGFGRLACAKEGQPYIVPIFFACEGRHVYCVSTFGRKIEWMRENPLVCLQVDEVTSPQNWISVVAFGRYREMPDTPEFQERRQRVWSLLQSRPLWWEPAYVKTILGAEVRPLAPVFFEIGIEQITGHRGQEAGE